MSTSITFDTITQPEVVRFLTLAFGSTRSWSDFLADCIRNRASFCHLQLLPVCYLPGTAGRIRRPLYHRADVLAFIRAAIERGATKPSAPGAEVIVVELDADQMRLPPAVRKPRLVSTSAGARRPYK